MRVVCGCCEPAAPVTPIPVHNRPSLAAVSYRIGTYAAFRQAMLHAIADHPELAGLTTRESDDYAITTIDLWAAVADVLTFYQERYANEAFLRTARFRDSVARLASLLDYRLRPGVAARASIVFRLEPDAAITIPAGQQIQSVPAGGALPQIFETTEAIEAVSALNRLRVFPPPTTTSPFAVGRTTVTLDRSAGPELARSLAPGHTVVLFKDGQAAAIETKEIASLRALDDRVELTWTSGIQRSSWNAADTSVRRFHRRLRIFGHDAPDRIMLPRADSGRIVWDLLDIEFGYAAGGRIELDGRYEGLEAGQQLLVGSASGTKRLVTIVSVEEANAVIETTTGAHARSASVTSLAVTPDHPGGDRRTLSVLELRGDEITFWDGAYPDALSGATVYLPGVLVEDDERGTGVEVGRTIERNELVPGSVLFLNEIEKGRTVLVEDDRDDHAPVTGTIKSAPTVEPPTASAGAFCHLVIELEVDGALVHDAATAVLAGNVAAASHGETVANETIGGGDAAATFQRLALGKAPLTYLPAATPGGTASTLELRVGGVRWQEVSGLFGQTATARVYELRHRDDGTTIVQFGDGVTGAAPPTGAGNVQARYRVGSGLAGRVPERSLTTLLAKPTGLSEATNPLAAEGGADAESLDDARENAPRTVRTFGRAVSLEDFEDLVTESGEVAKAHATWLWDGLDRAIHLTIAGQEGGAFSEEARSDLGAALDSARDPNHRLLIDNFVPIAVQVEAGIGIDPEHDADATLAAARAAIEDALSFDRQALGQSLHLSDFYRVLQDVGGVVFADIDRFHFKRPAGMSAFAFLAFVLQRGATLHPVQGHLRVFSARPHPVTPGRALPAELATLESPTQDVVITAREASS